MNMKRHFKKRFQRNMFLTAALALAMSLACSPVFAAETPYFEESGAYTISGTYDPDLGADTSLPGDTVYRLYQVGGFVHDEEGVSHLALRSELSEVPVAVDAANPDQAVVDLEISKDDYTAEEYGSEEKAESAWTTDWLRSAATLADYIEAKSLLEPSVYESEDGSFSFTGRGNGLYLLTGSRQRVGNTWWKPQPMLIQVLNGSVEVTTKPISEPVSEKYTVSKVWADSGHENVRPKSIDFEIYYGNELRETVTLPDQDGNWSYTWESDELDKEWRVIEVIEGAASRTYSVTTDTAVSGEADTTKLFTVTNTYDRRELEITKVLPNYVDHGENVSTSFVFEITGKDAAGNTVFHTFAGMQYEEVGEPIKLDSIPYNLATLMVKEVYAGGNYTPDEEEKTAEAVTVTETDASGAEVQKTKYSVSFTNRYDSTTKYSGGVANKYEKNGDSYEITERRGLK